MGYVFVQGLFLASKWAPFKVKEGNIIETPFAKFTTKFAFALGILRIIIHYIKKSLMVLGVLLILTAFFFIGKAFMKNEEEKFAFRKTLIAISFVSLIGAIFLFAAVDEEKKKGELVTQAEEKQTEFSFTSNQFIDRYNQSLELVFFKSQFTL